MALETITTDRLLEILLSPATALREDARRVFYELFLPGDMWLWFEALSPLFVCWSCLHTLFTCARIAHRWITRSGPLGQSTVETEGNAGALTMAITYLMFLAVIRFDVAGMSLLVWWSVGFWITVHHVLKSRREKYRIDWSFARYSVGWACKINYVLLAVVFIYKGAPNSLLAFSTWIITDQVAKAFISDDADRTRRTVDDLWLARALYPGALLVVPYIYPTLSMHAFQQTFSGVLFVMWTLGILRLVYLGEFLIIPDDSELLRNIPYFTANREHIKCPVSSGLRVRGDPHALELRRSIEPVDSLQDDKGGIPRPIYARGFVRGKGSGIRATTWDK